MSGDLSAAIEAAAREMYAYDRVPGDEAWPEWDALLAGSQGQLWQAIGYRDKARRAFAEFVPIIRAQVAEEIAQAIEAYAEHLADLRNEASESDTYRQRDAQRTTVLNAARIAREVTR